jgi:hypothetical protein
MTIRIRIYISVALLLLLFGSRKLHTSAYSQTHAANQHSEIDKKLIAACGKGDVKRAEALLREGARVNCADSAGVSPLIAACVANQPDLVRVLLARGAHVYQASKTGLTPLHFSAQFGGIACVKLLLNAGAHVNAEDKHGTTPLGLAVFAHHQDIADILRAAGGKGAGTGTDAKGTAPRDTPTKVTAQDAAQFRLLTHEALKTYPAAKERYLRGLPSGYMFSVTTTLGDASGRTERVFVLVQHIESGTIRGLIGNDIVTVKGYKYGDPYTLSESAVQDWTISRPDGTEEGNYIGKYIDKELERKKQ